MSNKVLIITASLLLVLGAAAGIGVYLILQIQSLSHPSEETAKFVPMETSFYVSMNLRPGAGQLKQAKDILDLFKENPKFEERLDELYSDIEEETGINMEEDLFPWVGPEIAIAVPTFDGIDEVPGFVAFIGTSDVVAAESFLRKLLAIGEESGEPEYEEGVTHGYLTFVMDPSDDVSPHVALTEGYIVIATGAETLESTLYRMQSGQERPSLFDNPGFQEAREAAESPRFGLMYVDVAAVMDQLDEEFDEEIVDSLDDFRDPLPDFIVASSSFIDEGILVSTSVDYPVQDQLFVPAITNSLGSAGLAPEDTVALLSLVGGQEAWEKIRDEAANLPDVDLDEVFDEVENEIGVDIDRDIFGWMTGELAIAMLLPGEASFSTDEIHASVYVEFDDRDKTLSSVEKIKAALEDGGVEFHVVDIEGVDAVVVDLIDEEELPSLMPGYVVLDEYVVVGTTLTSLRLAVEAERGDIPSLQESPAFGRSLAAAGTSTDLMIYGDIRRIVQEVLDQLEETELEEYGRTAAPFVDPLQAFLLGVTVGEDTVTVSTVITFATPTDAPTSATAPAQVVPPLDAQTPRPVLIQTAPPDTQTPRPVPIQAAPPDAQTPRPVPIQTAIPADMPTPEPTQTASSATAREHFENNTPPGYTSVTLRDDGVVWGNPTRYTTDSDHGTVAYMLLGNLMGCSFANLEVDRQSKVHIKIEPLGSLSGYAGQTVCRTTSDSWDTWDGLGITHFRFFDKSSQGNVREHEVAYVGDHDAPTPTQTTPP